MNLMTIHDMLHAARSTLRRVDPATANRLADDGALLVDIRPEAQREAHGEIPGSLIIERNHLEWRLDPCSDARIPQAVGHDIQVIVFCQEGYASSLAAASLQELGLWRATDLDGGFERWVADGLPVVPGGSSAGTITPAPDDTSAGAG
jgi:rhodanese-related sulfurtransferase